MGKKWDTSLDDVAHVKFITLPKGITILIKNVR